MHIANKDAEYGKIMSDVYRIYTKDKLGPKTTFQMHPYGGDNRNRHNFEIIPQTGSARLIPAWMRDVDYYGLHSQNWGQWGLRRMPLSLQGPDVRVPAGALGAKGSSMGPSE